MTSKAANQTVPEKVAVVLSGGGALAAYEVGAMKAILGGKTRATEHHPLNPDIYTGTSAGALNAALMAAHSTGTGHSAALALERIWLHDLAGSTAITDNGVLHLRLNPMSLLYASMDRSDPMVPLKQLAGDVVAVSQAMLQHGTDFWRSTGTLASRAMRMLDISSMICNLPLQLTLTRILDLKAIQNSTVLLRIAATNWTTGQLEVFGNADFAGDAGYAAVEASAALPGIFAPVVCGDSMYVDGGLIMNTPMKPAIDSGATEIHIIYVDPDIAAIPVLKLQNTMGMFERSLAIAFAARTNQDIENARWINEGLALARSKRAPESHSPREKKATTRTAARIRSRIEADRPHHELTIHRYHPKKDLGGGTGILDFSRDAIRKLIDHGYHETMRHDCAESGCVLPA
jgi:NTE family protein